MGQIHTLQRLTTVYNNVTQSSREWMDLSEVSSASVHVEVFRITSGHLAIDGALVAEGPWTEMKSWTSASDESFQLKTYYAAEYPLARFIRWRYDTSVNGSSACFRVRVEV